MVMLEACSVVRMVREEGAGFVGAGFVGGEVRLGRNMRVVAAFPIVTVFDPLPVAFVPTTISFCTVDADAFAFAPTYTLFEPVVSVAPAAYPIAVFEEPVVTWGSAKGPTAVLYAPVVSEDRAEKPAAVLPTRPACVR